MNRKNDEENPPAGKCYLAFIIGTAVRLSGATTHARVRADGADPHLLVKYLFIDYLPHLDPNTDAVLGMPTASFFGPECFIAAVIPVDKEALEKAERQGLLWPVSADWHRNPGASLENTGACASPRIGLVLIYLNRRTLTARVVRMFQQVASHANSDQRVLQGMEEASAGRPDVRVVASPVSGTGAGGMHWFLGPDGIRACAKQAGVTPNLILEVIARGNLATHDVERADLNQLTTFQCLRAVASGAYVSPVTGQIAMGPDMLFVFTNQNAHGVLLSYDQLLLVHGHCVHFLYHTPAGAKVRQRLVDIPSLEFDENGDPQMVYTMSCASIGRDSKRVVGYDSQRASAEFHRSLLVAGKPGRVRKQTAALARQIGIIESDRESQVTAPLLAPPELGENVSARVRASLMDRLGSSRGLRRASLIREFLPAIQGDITAVYEPLMRQTAQNRLKTATEVLDHHLDQTMRTDHGLWDGQRCFGFLKAVVSRSAQEIADKASTLQEYREPHEEILAEAEEQQDELHQRGRIARLRSYPLVRRIAPSVEQSALAVLDYHVQIAACQVALQNLLTPLADYLDRKLAWLGTLAHKIRQAAQLSENQAESIAAAPTTFHTALGIDLTDRNYLERGYTEQLAKENGPAGLAAHIRDIFLQRHGTLAWLTEASLEELRDAVTKICEDLFRPIVESTDALQEFERVYRSENQRKKVLGRLIKESEGLLPSAGEVDQPVVWLKAANVPSAQYLTPMKELLESIDPKPGKYDVAVSGDRDRFVVFQLRGGISLTPYIRRIALPDNEEGWAKAIEHAVDPVSAIMVGPNPTLPQFRRVLAKAVASGQITLDEHGGYQFHCVNDAVLALGRDFASVERKLRRNWPHLVFIESTFGRNLVVAEERTVAELQRILAELSSGRPPQDPCLGLFDLTAVRECAKQAELLLPRLRRIAEAIDKGVQP